MRTIVIILLSLFFTSCGSYYISTINHTPEYIGDVRVDVIENRIDLNWKLRTDRKFRWNFAQYAMNQPLSWYYDNSWELGLYRTNFSAFDFYWNRSEIWWNWSFGYPYNWGWNSWNRWPYFNYGWSYWNDPFRFGNGWAWGYNPHRWNYRPNYNQFIDRPERPRVIINGRRGSNNNSNIVINRGRSNSNDNIRIRRFDNNTNDNLRIRKYENKDRIVPRRNYNDIKIEDRTPVRNNNNFRVNPSNRNSNPIRVNPPVRTNQNFRSSSQPTSRPNISRGSSSSSRSVGRRGNN